MPAVVRIDTGGTHGYQARIGGSVGYESKLFSDKKCGGKRKAKAAAISWLEERGDRYAPRRFGPKKGVQVNNVSGTPGVHQSQLTRNGNISRYWAAHYSIGPNGRRTHRSKRFYYGTKRTDAEARALAEEFRNGWVEAFEAGGTDGVKQFFRDWEAKYPGRATPRKRGAAKAKKAQAKPTSTKTAAADKPSTKAATSSNARTKTPAAKTPAAKSAADRKAPTKKPSAKKTAADANAAPAKKPTGRKPATDKTTAAGKTESARKPAARKPAAKSATGTKTKTAADKKPAAKKPSTRKK